MFRLLKAYRADGAAGLISKQRGRRGNRRTPESQRDAALAIIRERYSDFGPTLAAEKLREFHGVTFAVRLSARTRRTVRGPDCRPDEAGAPAAPSARLRR